MAEKSHRQVDENGFLMVKDTPVSSFGIFDYSAEQVGITDGDPNRIVKVYRPESEINSKEAIESFQILPFIDEHDLLSGFEDDDDVMSPDEKGVDGVMVNIRYSKPWLRADVKVFTRRMKRAIDSGKVELSLGYGCDFILQSGSFEGQSYEVIQTNMRGNHLALVDAARVEGAKVLDSKVVAFDCLSFKTSTPKGDTAMATKNKAKSVIRRAKVGDASAVEKLKALIPALEQFLTEESEEPQHQEGAEPEIEEGAEPEIEEGAEPEIEEGAEPEIEDGQDLPSLISQVKEILAELEDKAEDGDPEEKVEDGELEGKAEDAVEGLQEGGEHKIAEDCGNGKASKGPGAGMVAGGSVAGDAAIRRSIYADIDRKNKLYDRVSPIIGAFDHAVMTAEDMAVYASKKLGIKAPKGAAAVALDSFLSGVERTKTASKKQSNSAIGDSAFGSFDPIDSYLNGSKK